MTEQQVEALMSAELMEAGVIKVTAPKLLPTDMPELTGITLWGIKSGYSVCNGFGFRSADDAATAMALMIPLDSEYIAGKSFVVESQKSDKLSIEKVTAHSRAEVVNNKSASELVAANTKNNETLLSEYRKAADAVIKVTQHVWGDWRECQRTAETYRKIVTTLGEYVGTCDGNREMAMTFLAKAFPQPDIDAAIEWCGEADAAA